MKHEHAFLMISAVLTMVLAGIAANTEMFQDTVLTISPPTRASSYCGQLKELQKAKDPRAKTPEAKRELTLCKQMATSIRCTQAASTAHSGAISGSASTSAQLKKQAESCAKSEKTRCQVVIYVAEHGNLTRDFPELLATLAECKK